MKPRRPARSPRRRRVDLASFSDQLDDLGIEEDYTRGATRAPRSTWLCARRERSIAEAVGREPRPLSFVVSTRGDIRAWLELSPTLRFKVDARNAWTDEIVAELAATGAVDVVDLKGHYAGDWVDADPTAELYARVVDAFPDAYIEDAWLDDETRPVLEPHRDRLTWDAPIHSVAMWRRSPSRARRSTASPRGSVPCRGCSTSTTTVRRMGSGSTAAASSSSGLVAARFSCSPRCSTPTGLTTSRPASTTSAALSRAADEPARPGAGAGSASGGRSERLEARRAAPARRPARGHAPRSTRARFARPRPLRRAGGRARAPQRGRGTTPPEDRDGRCPAASTVRRAMSRASWGRPAAACRRARVPPISSSLTMSPLARCPLADLDVPLGLLVSPLQAEAREHPDRRRVYPVGSPRASYSSYAHRHTRSLPRNRRAPAPAPSGSQSRRRGAHAERPELLRPASVVTACCVCVAEQRAQATEVRQRRGLAGRWALGGQALAARDRFGTGTADMNSAISTPTWPRFPPAGRPARMREGTFRGLGTPSSGDASCAGPSRVGAPARPTSSPSGSRMRAPPPQWRGPPRYSSCRSRSSPSRGRSRMGRSRVIGLGGPSSASTRACSAPAQSPAFGARRRAPAGASRARRRRPSAARRPARAGSPRRRVAAGRGRGDRLGRAATPLRRRAGACLVEQPKLAPIPGACSRW